MFWWNMCVLFFFNSMCSQIKSTVDQQPSKFWFSSSSHPKVPFIGNFRTPKETIVAP